MSFLNSCRTCLLEIPDKQFQHYLKKILQCGEENVELSEMISLCTGLELFINDNYPNNICDQCLLHVQIAYKFRQKCWDSEVFLKTQYCDIKEDDDNIQDVKPEINSIFISECRNNIEINAIQTVNTAKDEPIIAQENLPILKDEVAEHCDLHVEDFSSNSTDDDTETKSDSIIDKLPLKTNSDKSSKNKPKNSPIKEKRVRKPPQAKTGSTVCDICGQTFATPQSLNGHKKCCHDNERRFGCDLCDYRAYTKHRLKNHMRIHTGERPYECEICHKFFKTLGQLKVHRTIHFDDTPYPCKVCDAKFKSVVALSKHKTIHNTASRLKCSYCEKSFRNAQYLKRHTRMHTNDRPYKCDICEKRFIQKTNLNTHFKRFCGRGIMPKIVVPKVVDKNLKLYKCNICDASFRKEPPLIFHRKSHDPTLTKYPCEYCDKSFYGREQLRKHTFLHTRDRIYKCDVCSAEFRHPEYLSRHKKKASCKKRVDKSLPETTTSEAV